MRVLETAASGETGRGIVIIDCDWIAYERANRRANDAYWAKF